MSKKNFNKEQVSPETNNQEDLEKTAEKPDQAEKTGNESESAGAGSSETADDKPGEPETTKAAKKSKTPSGMEEYFKQYPKEKVFYRTADGQVFLEANKQWAREHSNHIGGEVETIKRS